MKFMNTPHSTRKLIILFVSHFILFMIISNAFNDVIDEWTH